MSNVNVQQIEDIAVAQVKSDNGPAGASKAFVKLESRMDSLKGRKMYGVFYPETGEYFVCVKLDEEYPNDMGFEKSIIPGGRYAIEKIENWNTKVSQIKTFFEGLANECKDEGLEIDETRPNIEFYRSFTELILMIPVK